MEDGEQRLGWLDVDHLAELRRALSCLDLNSVRAVRPGRAAMELAAPDAQVVGALTGERAAGVAALAPRPAQWIGRSLLAWHTHGSACSWRGRASGSDAS